MAALAIAMPLGAQAQQNVAPTDAQMSGTLPGLLATPRPTQPLLPGQISAEPAPAAPVGGSTDGPVTFTADEVEYDRERERVVARGRVEAWQGGRFLRADSFIYDRATRIAVVRGNVQIIEADGQVLYAEEAELGEGFRDGVLTEVRARLAQNARMAGNGARRTGGTVNEISRVVYSSCNLCERDPTRPPLWQMSARIGTQDRESQRISYRDATIRLGGVPVLYTPFFSHPDPQTPRASGFLFPTLGYTRFLGAFAQTPYFWAIDETQDLLVTPTVSQDRPPNLSLEYRRRFNSGEVQAQGSVGYLTRRQATELNAGLPTAAGVAGHIFSRGRFAINENWRVGFDLNRASSDSYLRTYRFEYRRVLTSQIFAEGFWGTEHYARVDSRYYQGLRSTDDTSRIPLVAPNAFYEYAPRKQILGGYMTFDVGALGLTRSIGSFSQRLASRAAWERTLYGTYGDVWTLRGRADAIGFTAGGQELQPTNLPNANGTNVNGNVRTAVDWWMPFIRQAGEWGSQIIEPRVQLVTGPNMGQQTRFPNEDSIDFEFSDANLFQLNRFTGRDRLEGGTRVDAALRGIWNFTNGGKAEALVGRSYRLSEQTALPTGAGLDRRASDWVGRASLSPVSWIEVLGRARVDGETGRNRANEAVASVSLGSVGFLDNVFINSSYLFSPPQPALVNDRGRNEVSVGGGAQFRTAGGGVWRASGSVRYDLKLERPVLIQGVFGYEDECFILEGRLLRRFAQDPVTRQDFVGNTVFLIRIGFKTVGDYFARAI